MAVAEGLGFPCAPNFRMRLPWGVLCVMLIENQGRWYCHCRLASCHKPQTPPGKQVVLGGEGAEANGNNPPIRWPVST